ncbi:MAG: Wzy polymerase domain-containing protein [Methylotenera sp.]
MFLLPFVNIYHQQPIPSFYAEWVAAVLGLLSLSALLKQGSWQPVQIPQIALVMLGLVAILGMQWMLNMLHSTQYALLVFSYMALMFFLMVLGSYLRRALGWEKIATTLAWCMVIGGMINVVIVALQFAIRSGIVTSFIPNYSSYGAIAQANHFADFIALATISLLYLYAKGKFSLKLFSIFLALFLVMLSFTGSRSSWLYLASTVVLAIMLQVNAMKQGTGSKAMRRLLRASLLLLPAFAIAQLLIHYGLSDELVMLPTERAVELASPTSVSARMQIWYDSLRLFWQSPWLGIGAGQIRAETFLLADMPSTLASKRIFENAHNLFLHLLAEMGIGGFLLVFVGLFAWLRGFKWHALNLETWWLIALLGVLGIHSMLEYPLWFAYFSCVVAFLLGAGDEKLCTINLSKTARRLAERFGHVFACTVLVVFMALGAVNLGTMMVANIKLENVVMGVVGQESNEQDEQLDWIHSYSLLSPYAELMYTLSMAVNPSHIEDKLWLSESAMRFRPMRRVAYQHVLLLKLNGDEAAAVKHLNRTLIVHPGNFKGELEAMPFKYWQDYLDVLSIARPIKKRIPQK